MTSDERMKVTKEQFDKIVDACALLKELMPEDSTYTLSFGPVMQNTETLSFFRYISVNGNVIDVKS